MPLRASAVLALALLAGACASAQTSARAKDERRYNCEINIDTSEGWFHASSPVRGWWRSPKLTFMVFFAPPLVNDGQAAQDAPGSISFQFGYEFGANVYKRNRPFTARVSVGNRIRPATFDRHQVKAAIANADLSYLLEEEGDIRATLHAASGEMLQQVVLTRPALERASERLDFLQAQVGEKERDPKTMCEDITDIVLI